MCRCLPPPGRKPTQMLLVAGFKGLREDKRSEGTRLGRSLICPLKHTAPPPPLPVGACWKGLSLHPTPCGHTQHQQRAAGQPSPPHQRNRLHPCPGIPVEQSNSASQWCLWEEQGI